MLTLLLFLILYFCKLRSKTVKRRDREIVLILYLHNCGCVREILRKTVERMGLCKVYTVDDITCASYLWSKLR